MPLTITSRSDGEILTAAKYNTDRQAIADGLTPSVIDDYSTNLTQMQTLSSPGSVGAETLATSLATELTQLRWAIAEHKGTTHWYSNQNVINVKSKRYGALGDGVTNDTVAITAALAAATSGSEVYFPPGTYIVNGPLFFVTSNVTLRGEPGLSVIKNAAGANLSQGLLTIGYNGATIAVTDIRVIGLVLDATARHRAIFVVSCTRGWFEDNIFRNGYSGISYFSSCTDITIQNNYITNSGAGDAFGDGIYMENALRPRILFNIVFDFTRIGIVTEGSGGASNSKDVLIMGNNIRYGHNASTTESNAGIWCEHTNGARIENNVVRDVYNTPGSNLPKGITIGGSITGNSTFVIRDNVISDVTYGLYLSPGIDFRSSVIAEGNTIEAGVVHTTYEIGCYVLSATFFRIANNYFGTTTHTTGTNGSIVIDPSTNISQVSISGNVHDQVTQGTDGADINFIEDNSKVLTDLFIDHEIAYIQMRDPFVNVVITDSNLVSTGTNYRGINANGTLRMVNTNYTVAGTATFSIGFWNGGDYRMSGCTFTALGFTTGSANGGTITVLFDGCRFLSGSYININSGGYVTLRGCHINEYRTYANGAFLTGATNVNTYHVRLSDCDFVSTTNEIPVKLITTQPASFITSGCTCPVTVGTQWLRSYGGLVADGNQGVDVMATASLPAAGSAQNGRVIIEDAAVGDRNLIIYAGGERFRIDGGANV